MHKCGLVGLLFLLSVATASAADEQSPCELTDAVHDLRLVTRAGQFAHTGMENVTLRDKGARVIPDAMEQTFELDDFDAPLGDRLDKYNVATYIFANTSSELVQAGADGLLQPGSDAAGLASKVRALSDRFDLRKLDWTHVSVVADSAGKRRTQLRVYLPAISTRLGLLLPIRQSTFAVIGCPKPGSGAGSMIQYMVEQDVSSRWYALVWAALVTAVVYLLVALGLASGRAGGNKVPGARPGLLRRLDPVFITQDSLGFGSASRLQVFFFTVVIAATLGYVFLRAGYLSEIPTTLLYLLGIVGVGGTLSKLVGNARANLDDDLTLTTDRWLTRHGVVFPPRTPRWWDLLVTGKEFDVYKFQGLVFSGLVGMWILSSGVTNLADITIPANITLLLGLSQAVAVGGKAVAGPSRKGLNDAVRRAIAAEVELLKAIPATDPYHYEAQKRGLAYSLGQNPAPQQAQVPSATQAAYAAFKTEVAAVVGLASQLLGGGRAIEVEPVEPADDTASGPFPAGAG